MHKHAHTACGLCMASSLGLAHASQVLPERYGGAARLIPVDEAVAAARAAAAGAGRGSEDDAGSSGDGASAAAHEGRLAAAKAALRRWTSAGWGAAQRPLRVRARPMALWLITASGRHGDAYILGICLLRTCTWRACSA